MPAASRVTMYITLYITTHASFRNAYRSILHRQASEKQRYVYGQQP
jgi:hypothetical protein